MRKVYLEDLPHKGKAVKWGDCVGEKVKFVYDEISGYMYIKSYKNAKLTLIYNDNEYVIGTQSFRGVRFEWLLKDFIDTYKYKIGDIINGYKIIEKTKVKKGNRYDKAYVIRCTNCGVERIVRQDSIEKVPSCIKCKKRVKNDRQYKYKVGDVVSQLQILCFRIVKKKKSKLRNEEEYLSNAYDVKCMIDGYYFTIDENSLLNGIGCSCCAGKVIVKGINDIATTHTNIVKYIVNAEDSHKYGKGSHSRIKVICPDCASVKTTAVGNLCNYGFTCDVCSDSVSYPEKLVANVLDQLGVAYIKQLNKSIIDWCEKYRYDFYLCDYNTIIETHGLQHYSDRSGHFKATAEEVQYNDSQKRMLAVSNNIDKYIELDCRYSKLEFIKNNILKSEINDILDLKIVDWMECHRFATKSILIDICNAWKEKDINESVSCIANKFNLNRATARKYLKIGNELELCEYSVDNERNNKNYRKNMNKYMVDVFKDGIYIGRYQSVKHLSSISSDEFGISFSAGQIARVCRGELSKYMGYTFKYVAK